MYEQDYILRLIKEIIRTLLKLIFHLDVEQSALREEDLEADLQAESQKLTELMEDGQINDAENRLWEKLDGRDQGQFKMAMLFYLRLNEKDDEFLKENNYSREEIVEGLKYVSGMFGYEGITDIFLEKTDISIEGGADA